jgi:predicted N-acyltransferase
MQSRIIENIDQVAPQDWDRCATSAISGFNPFCSYGFLSALEESGCVSAHTGWLPQHVILENNNEVIGVLPMYLKNHSKGEYVFDHAWANAYYQAGGVYYPKLQCSIPFSPVTGPRLLASDMTAREILLEAAIKHAEVSNVSSLHFTFIENDELDIMKSHGLLYRTDQQFHWINNEYKNFEQFLCALSSRKRKNIKKERMCLQENDIEIEQLNGTAIQEHHWDAYFTFYMDTADRKWGRPYLNRDFFSLMSQNMSEKILLIMAKRDGKYIAGALNLIGPKTLYGRYWGATEHYKFLHFELCYYQAIDYAISNGLTRVEAGAQGDHKIARGYVPVLTKSAHWIANPAFKDAIKKYLAHERKAVERDVEFLSDFAPFKKS